MSLVSLVCVLVLASLGCEQAQQDNRAAAGPPPIGVFTTVIPDHWSYVPPGDYATPIVSLARTAVTSWPAWFGVDATQRVSIDEPVRGARWFAKGKLGVGLGVFDTATHSFVVDPALVRARKTVTRVAWAPNGSWVAVLEKQVPLLCRCTDREVPYKPDELDLVIIDRTTGPVAGNASTDGDPELAASNDRVLVTGPQTSLVDRSGRLIRPTPPLPTNTRNPSFGEGVFVVVNGEGITLVDPAEGATKAEWPLDHVEDAVAIPHGVVALQMDGTLRVGCTAGASISTRVRLDAIAPHEDQVQIVGDRIVLAGESVRAAPFTNPCR